MALKRRSILLIMVFLIGCFVCACGKEDSVARESLVEDTEEVSSTEETKSAEEEAAEQWEKGYDLPVDEQEREEAETDCKKQMELYLDIYETADKGIASNVVLDDQTVLEMQKKLTDAGYPVTTMVTYSNMENYESVDSFLKECMEGKSGSAVIYEVHNDGGLGRMKFIFDGTDMYVVSANIIEPTLLYNPNYNPNIWMPEVIQKESIHTVLETMKKVISEPTATGYGLHREEYTLAGKTGTAEIKLSKEDATGTELGWMAVFTTDPNIENPILLISMVEDVKNIGGSGYVVQKDKRVLDQYLR